MFLLEHTTTAVTKESVETIAFNGLSIFATVTLVLRGLYDEGVSTYHHLRSHKPEHHAHSDHHHHNHPEV